MKRALSIVFLFALQLVAIAQPVELLDKRREALRATLEADEMALVISYPVKQMSRDINYEYHPNPNIRYLTGISEPGVILILLSDALAKSAELESALLFVRPKNQSDAVWHGERLGPNQSGVISGLKGMELSELEGIIRKVPAKSLSLVDMNSLPQKDPETNDQRRSLSNWISSNAIKVNDALYDEIAELRKIKDSWEIDQMRRVIEISCLGHQELMKASKNELSEYQMEAVIESVFRWNGARKPAYPSIIGGKQNSCVLHYWENTKDLEQNDFVVADVGAEYKGYTADITRSFPVGGNFSEEQKLIYELVLKAQKAGIEECRVGKSFRAPDAAARAVIAEGLKELGLIDNFMQHRKYFMHGTSHYLGLDVHDVGSYDKLQAGSIITVEPGIYIPEGSNCDPKWWNIGIRIEDDILITPSDPENLSDCVTKEIPEIESLMKEPSIFDKWKKQAD